MKNAPALLSHGTRSLIALLALGWTLLLGAADQDYGLAPQPIADNTWVLVGRSEDFSFTNGGNIVNAAFIVTRDGVVVIDSGPSLAYGQQLRRAIARITDQPVKWVINTHHHPDHFLGNQAFDAATLAALPGTIKGIQSEGGAFNENMFRLAGDWMAGTEPVAPGRALAAGPLEIGGHHLELIALDGHTEADLVILDRTTGVLFAGDLVFHDRAPTTPHADIARWQASLSQLGKLSFKTLVPGHGPVSAGPAPIRQTSAWLAWLDNTLRQAADDGLDMTEVLALPMAPEFRKLAISQAEYHRSVGHLYPAYELKALSGGRRGK